MYETILVGYALNWLSYENLALPTILFRAFVVTTYIYTTRDIKLHPIRLKILGELILRPCFYFRWLSTLRILLFVKTRNDGSPATKDMQPSPTVENFCRAASANELTGFHLFLCQLLPLYIT